MYVMCTYNAQDLWTTSSSVDHYIIVRMETVVAEPVVLSPLRAGKRKISRKINLKKPKASFRGGVNGAFGLQVAFFLQQFEIYYLCHTWKILNMYEVRYPLLHPLKGS